MKIIFLWIVEISINLQNGSMKDLGLKISEE